MVEGMEEIKIPTQAGSPTSEHGQIMYTLGKMAGDIASLKDAKILQNGKVFKSENDIVGIKEWMASQKGEESAISSAWLLGFNIITALGVIVSIYFTIKK